MKKIMITLAMSITLVMGAFANDKNVNPDVLEAFKNKFANATEVSWKNTSTYHKVDFQFNGAWLTAYFNNSAQLLYVTRNISSAQLPMFLQNKLKNQYKDYWITDLFELSNNEGFSYYITLQDSDNKVVLESKNGTEWKQLLKTKN